MRNRVGRSVAAVSPFTTHARSLRSHAERLAFFQKARVQSRVSPRCCARCSRRDGNSLPPNCGAANCGTHSPTFIFPWFSVLFISKSCVASAHHSISYGWVTVRDDGGAELRNAGTEPGFVGLQEMRGEDGRVSPDGACAAARRPARFEREAFWKKA